MRSLALEGFNFDVRYGPFEAANVSRANLEARAMDPAAGLFLDGAVLAVENLEAGHVSRRFERSGGVARGCGDNGVELRDFADPRRATIEYPRCPGVDRRDNSRGVFSAAARPETEDEEHKHLEGGGDAHRIAGSRRPALS